MYEFDDIHTVFDNEEACRQWLSFIKEDYKSHWREIDDETENWFRVIDRSCVYITEQTVYDTFINYYTDRVLHFKKLEDVIGECNKWNVWFGSV